ncbi:phage tail tape measure protein [Sphingomonas paucimobilis]|uniref:phage tail tape measure protein n=1 Tax=Sphingomonas paucimobilis TaxID=13689 RepID=UPI000DE3E31D|nr:phage tail tape measure protein [Sphingomonas paucimobilis]QBE91493.1 phage tail tape measure protein [Sphingomonas paucimobilis]
MEAMLANLTFGMNVRDEAFKAALSSDREALRQTERQFQQSGDGMGASMQEAADAVNRAAAAMVNTFSRTVDSVRKAGLAMTVALTVPTGLLGKAAKDTASDFQTSMNDVRAALMTASPKEMNALREAALALGPAYGKSAVEAATAIASLGRNGMSAASILGGGLQSALKMAVVGQTDLSKSADLTTDVMSQFNMRADQTAMIVDKISGALDASKLNMDDYRLAAGNAGGVVGALGYTFDDFNTGLAATAPLFDSGAQAGTSYRAFLTSLAGKSEDAVKAQSQLGLELYKSGGEAKSLGEIADQLQRKMGSLSDRSKTVFLNKMFGDDGAQTAVQLIKVGLDGVLKAQKEIGAVTADQKIAVLLDGEAAATQRLASSWEQLKIKIGEAGLVQIMTAIKDIMASTISMIAKAPPAFFYLFTSIGVVVAAAGPLITALSSIVALAAPMIATTLLLRSGLGMLGVTLAAVANPAGMLGRLLGVLALRAGSAMIIGRLGSAIFGVLGPLGALAFAVTTVIQLMNDNRQAEQHYVDALDQSRSGVEKATQLAQQLAFARGKQREETIAAIKAERALAVAQLATARKSLADARRDSNASRNPSVGQRVYQVLSAGGTDWDKAIDNRVAGMLGVNLGKNRMEAARNVEASAQSLGNVIDRVKILNDALSEAAKPNPTIDLAFDDGKGGAKGDAARDTKGRDGAQDEARYLDDLGRARVDYLRARADMTDSARARHTADVAALEEDRAAYGRQVELDKGLTDAKRQTLLAKRDEADEIERAVIDQTLFRAETQATYDIAVAENEAQQDHLRAQLDLVDSVQQRRDIELKLLDLQRQKEEDDLELILATKANTSSEWEKARLRKDQLDGIYADRRGSVMRQNESPADAYGRTVNASAAAINERVQEGAINGLRDLNAGLTDAIMGTAKLGDAFENMGKRIIASLLDIAIQQAVIRPMADALFGKADAQGNRSGGSLASIGSFFARTFGGGRATGGPVSSSGWYVVGEQGPELFAPGVNGAIVPNGGLAAGSGRSPSVVQLVVGEGQMFEPRVQSISGGVSVQTVRSAGRSNAIRARQSLD